MSDLSSTQLLEQTYRALDLDRGMLVSADTLSRQDIDRDVWRAHGDWLLLAGRMGADRVFFVGEDPVIVFAAVGDDAPETELVDAYRKAWSLSRPRCLFLVRGGELRVYALSAPPTVDSAGVAHVEPIEIVERAADVERALRRFHRDRVEAGIAFESPEFATRKGRADHRLIADVTAASDALATAGLDRAVAHTLIERVILVRYLEDRKIIVPEYLLSVAAERPEWAACLTETDEVPNLGAPSSFVKCLANADLAYAVFDRLASDFNGDLFVPGQQERELVSAEHLALIKSLLEGTASVAQEPLFLWAYDFGVVPTSLISTMYEVFYQEDVVSQLTGTHYTPSELVEFTLAETLSDDVLSRSPRICDPACGSGIFLVEAFRMVVRFEAGRLGRRLTASELRDILLHRIAGVDLNEEAVRLAAFSLYLAFLNYQTPQDIREAGPLPRLIAGPPDVDAVLVVSDAFAPMRDEDGWTEDAGLPWPTRSFDVVVGNPPWTEPKAADRGMPDDWAKARAVAVGDRNRSQLFLWRALDLLTDDGTGSMLVAASAFVATRGTSREFRRAWLSDVNVTHVVNFSQVRRYFFTKAVAPFFLVSFGRAATANGGHGTVVYETAVPSVALKHTRSLSFARLDRRVVDQGSLKRDDRLWKLYSWGGHRDEALMARLDVEKRLADVLPQGGPEPGYGYQWGNKEPSPTLKELRSLKSFLPWGGLREGDFEPVAEGVSRQPDERMYFGPRILVRRGVASGFGPYARFVDEPLSFRHLTYCLPLPGVDPWKARVLVGIMLSALSRYRLFMTASAWGQWYDQVYLHELLDLPVRLDERAEPTKRIAAAVDRLYRVQAEASLFDEQWLPASTEAPEGVLRDIDTAVYDLFDLSPEERDIVEDFWARMTSRLPPVSVNLLPTRYGVDPPDGSDPLSVYLRTFMSGWNGLLGSRGARLHWEAAGDRDIPVTAAVFRLVPDGSDATPATLPGEGRWREVLERFASAEPYGEPHRVFREGYVRAVSDDGIVVVKRNDGRLWTPTAAREDVEATVLQATRLAPA